MAQQVCATQRQWWIPNQKAETAGSRNSFGRCDDGVVVSGTASSTGHADNTFLLLSAGGKAWAQAGPGPGPRGQDRISYSKSVLNMSPSKLRLDPSLSIKVLPHPCSSQTLFRLIPPEPLFAEPILVTPEQNVTYVKATRCGDFWMLRNTF